MCNVKVLQLTLKMSLTFRSIVLPKISNSDRFCMLCIPFIKKKRLKHDDFASEWWRSIFRGLQISKFSGGECHRTLPSKILGPRQLTFSQIFSEMPLTGNLLEVEASAYGHPWTPLDLGGDDLLAEKNYTQYPRCSPTKIGWV